MVCSRNLYLFLALLLLAPQAVIAQERGLSTQRSASDVDSLRNRIEEGEAQVERLQKTVERQSDLIQRQQKLLEELERKLSQVSAPVLTTAGFEKSTPTPAVTSASSPSAAIKDEKSVSAATPKATQNVETGNGKIRFNGLLQGWYQADPTALINAGVSQYPRAID
jgi:TolA-binding protein